jgi:hypothetical protein
MVTTTAPGATLPIPAQVSELTAEWFSQVLHTGVHSGTTGRARVRLGAPSEVPDKLFVKLQPFAPDQRELLRQVGLGGVEARVYAHIGADAATSTAAMGSKWQPIEIARAVMVRTTEAVDDLDAVGLLEERLSGGSDA